MKEFQSIQIPLTLFNDIMSFFYYLEFSNHRFPAVFDLHGMVSKLNEKQHSINLRKSYKDIICARNDEQKRAARVNYLCLKDKRR